MECLPCARRVTGAALLFMESAAAPPERPLIPLLQSCAGEKLQLPHGTATAAADAATCELLLLLLLVMLLLLLGSLLLSACVTSCVACIICFVCIVVAIVDCTCFRCC